VTKKATFEDDLARLEALVERLERDELGLEDSLEAFEEGMKLSEALTKALAKAQKKVMKLMRDADGSPSLEEFDDDDGEES